MMNILKQFILRRHPEYSALIEHWKFLMATYVGGKGWFADNIFRYYKEGDEEFGARVKRAYRFNHTREIVDLVSKYIFKSKVHRNEVDASEAVRAFWKKPTLGNLDMAQFARQLSDKASIYGRIWVVVDSSKNDGAVSIADEKEQNGRIYAYIISPENALDMSFDAEGELNWILVHEEIRDDADPFNSTGDLASQYRLWTRTDWRLFKQSESDSQQVDEIDSGVHGLGVVPVIPLDHITNDESKYSSPALIGDIAYLDRAVANYLSNLDAIVQDQTFSQLAIPIQGILRGSDAHKQALEMGTKRIFTFDGEGGSQPFYLAPDPKQAQLIITAIRQIINEIYHSVGMAGERTKQDNAMGIDNSSGVAKAYDFERVNALLASKAGMLMRVENKITDIVNLWSAQSNMTDNDLVLYPATFDTRGLYDEFDIAERLMDVSAPELVRRNQMEQVIEKLFPQIGDAKIQEMIAELKEWPVDPIENSEVGDMGNGSQSPTSGGDGAQEREQS